MTYLPDAGDYIGGADG